MQAWLFAATGKARRRSTGPSRAEWGGSYGGTHRTLFLICLARRTKPSVPSVSWTQLLAGLTLAIITVRALPPSESCTQRGREQ